MPRPVSLPQMPPVDSEIPVLHPPAGVEWQPSQAVDTQTPLSDHELMLSVRDGDIDCMGELFERHHGPLFGYLSKLTGNRAAAEDIRRSSSSGCSSTGTRTGTRANSRHGCTTWRAGARRTISGGPSARPFSVDPSDLETGRRVPERRPVRRRPRRPRAPAEGARAPRPGGPGGAPPVEAPGTLLRRDRAILECSVGAARVRAHRALATLSDHYFQIQKETPHELQRLHRADGRAGRRKAGREDRGALRGHIEACDACTRIRRAEGDA